MSTDQDTYAGRQAVIKRIDAPELNYLPPQPKRALNIGMIGTGGITPAHLDAYRTAGWSVGALWNRTKATAEQRGAEYAPNARIVDNWQDILADQAIDVVDITPHPDVRLPMVEAALKAGKHVLSQKPFVTDLETGERLVALADEHGVKLAVNQNGRWAPHLSWMREAVKAGHVGTLQSCHCNCHWDHNWTKGTSFEEVPSLILYDFAVHWCDFLTSVAGDRIQSVVATEGFAIGQDPKVRLLAQMLVRLEGGQASLIFDGAARFGGRDTTLITGTQGTLQSDGPDLGVQQVSLTTEKGRADPALSGTWFNDGFRGAMGELMCAIEEDRDPLNSARGNLDSLALCFAAIASVKQGREIDVGSIRKLP